jgi:hypothetical protein
MIKGLTGDVGNGAAAELPTLAAHKHLILGN